MMTVNDAKNWQKEFEGTITRLNKLVEDAALQGFVMTLHVDTAVVKFLGGPDNVIPHVSGTIAINLSNLTA